MFGLTAVTMGLAVLMLITAGGYLSMQVMGESRAPVAARSIVAIGWLLAVVGVLSGYAYLVWFS